MFSLQHSWRTTQHTLFRERDALHCVRSVHLTCSTPLIVWKSQGTPPGGFAISTLASNMTKVVSGVPFMYNSKPMDDPSKDLIGSLSKATTHCGDRRAHYSGQQQQPRCDCKHNNFDRPPVGMLNLEVWPSVSRVRPIR